MPLDNRIYRCAITAGSIVVLLPPLWAILLCISVLVRLRRPTAT
jgi:hypothetical protein